MSRPATTRLKVNEPLGVMPVLQFCTPAQLQIDPAYQRSLETGVSQTLIRKIAMFWNWDLCQPLVVARRSDMGLYVVDGQHRLASARLRGDIAQLPCVIASYRSPAEEAAAFVALNQQRKPLNAIDLFKAALVAGDEEALAVVALMRSAGLSLAPHSNHTAWLPGMVSNIGGIRNAYRIYGRDVTSAALVAISTAFPAVVLQYAGTIFTRVARCYAKFLQDRDFDPDMFLDVLGGCPQKEWVDEFRLEQASTGGGIAQVGERVLAKAYGEAIAEMQEAA